MNNPNLAGQVRQLRAEGWHVFTVNCCVPGAPDLLALRRQNGRTEVRCLICRTADGTLSAEQRDLVEAMPDVVRVASSEAE